MIERNIKCDRCGARVLEKEGEKSAFGLVRHNQLGTVSTESHLCGACYGWFIAFLKLEMVLIDGEDADRLFADSFEYEALKKPIPVVLHCPECKHPHIDAPDPASGWDNPPHKTHLCMKCGHTWRPCRLETYGVDLEAIA